MSEMQDLLLQIARCELINCARVDTHHPCHKIVHLQEDKFFQVPEPWSGRIHSAPILFISSNPSINELEDYPETAWEDPQITEFFQDRFENPALGLKARLKDGTRTNVIRFWAACRARASEILQKDRHTVRPGIDFALTEVVHCKSRNEEGVKEARDTCGRRHLRAVLGASSAPVFVVYGEFARETIRDHFSLLQLTATRLGEAMIGSHLRKFVFLPHPNARNVLKGLLDNIGNEGIKQIRGHLRASWHESGGKTA